MSLARDLGQLRNSSNLHLLVLPSGDAMQKDDGAKLLMPTQHGKHWSWMRVSDSGGGDLVARASTGDAAEVVDVFKG
jgi:hypothetical protein